MSTATSRNRRLHTMRGTNLWELLCQRASASPDATFVEWHPYGDHPARSWTYREFLRDASSLGAGLQARGVRRGEKVLIHLENSPEFLLSWFGCVAIGAVAVTTNTRSAKDELAYYADDCGAVAAITQPAFVDLVAAAAPRLSWAVTTSHDSGDPVHDGDPANESHVESLFTDPDSLEAAPSDISSPLSVQYTSGTTSRPKGVLWTHGNGLWAARINAVHEALRPDDCHLAYMPLFHTNALAYSFLASLYVGARVVVVPKWSTSRFADLSVAHGCTWLSLIGISGRTIAEGGLPDGHRYRMFGGAICDPPFATAAGIKMIGWWGMTETLTHGIVGDPYTPNRSMAIGRPAPEYEIAVVRADGTPVDDEETGNLLIRGVQGVSLFAEYLNQPDSTAAAFDDDGWFSTGDLVTPHADGYLTFADRSKDMLKVGGENVAASEVERVAAMVPGVTEVAVVAGSDPALDEIPIAFVIGAASELDTAVRDACADQLADFKVPRRVIVVDEMPRSTLGKVNKAELRRTLQADEDLTEAQLRWRAESAADPSGNAG
ncbi:MAG: AMP-binding protein [Actinomycetota bacterium]|nr:AMP-binding protein [Actinomycetota bacterium]